MAGVPRRADHAVRHPAAPAVGGARHSRARRAPGDPVMTQRLRTIVVAALLLATAGYLRVATHAEPISVREPLARCPLTLSNWRGQHAAPFDQRTLEVLGVDEYVHRVYVNERDHPVSL